MNWYLSKLVYRIICGDGDHKAQFDEQLRLIIAEDEKVAFAKARAVGRQESDMFMNQKAILVRWQFLDVAELYKISALIDGAELYSKIYESEDPELYIQNVYRKASHIQKGGTHQFLQLL